MTASWELKVKGIKGVNNVILLRDDKYSHDL